MLWRRQQRWEAFASASATLSLTSLVGGLKTMSPAPGRRPPIYTVIWPPHVRETITQRIGGSLRSSNHSLSFSGVSLIDFPNHKFYNTTN